MSRESTLGLLDESLGSHSNCVCLVICVISFIASDNILMICPYRGTFLPDSISSIQMSVNTFWVISNLKRLQIAYKNRWKFVNGCYGWLKIVSLTVTHDVAFFFIFCSFKRLPYGSEKSKPAMCHIVKINDSRSSIAHRSRFANRFDEAYSYV